MSRRNPLFKKKRASEEMTIQITSMADIFTIILVFLLKSYATSSIQIQPSSGLKLPIADSADAQVEAIHVEVSEKSVQVDHQPVSILSNFRFETSDLQNNGTSRSLHQSFQTQKKKQLLIAQSNSDVKADKKILIVADQRTPYVTLKTVFASAAQNGYSDLKLVVAKRE
jgi:biopolymer transport protein ExbD